MFITCGLMDGVEKVWNRVVHKPVDNLVDLIRRKGSEGKRRLARSSGKAEI